MEDVAVLREAFLNFTSASRSLETYYDRLHQQVQQLTGEVEAANLHLQQALEETEEAKDYLQGVIQGLSEAIIVTDPQGTITLMNRAAGDLCGVPLGEAIGAPIDSLGIRLNREQSDTVLWACGRRHVVLESRSQVWDREGGSRGQVLLLQDITRLKELEEQQERNHRLIAMGEMAAKIVHEIRSPLCSIELYASMLAKDLEGTCHIEMAKGISTGIRGLNAILANMLFFARPQKPVFREFRVREVLDECIFMLAPTLGGRRVTVDTGAPASLNISGDRELIKQALLNVLINALQVSPENGRVSVSLEAADSWVVFRVVDDGPGIGSHDLERIFDPFYSTKEKGTGLGLSIAARIIQAHGGAISAGNDADRGACFRLQLPVREAVTCQAAASGKES